MKKTKKITKNSIAIDKIKNSNFELVEWLSSWYMSYGYYWRDCILKDRVTGIYIYNSVEISPEELQESL